MRSILIFAFFTLFILLMDLYAFRGIQQLAGNIIEGKAWFPVLFWGLSLAMLGALGWAGSRFMASRNPGSFTGTTIVMGIFLMLYVPKLLFNVLQLAGDLGNLILRLAGQHGEILRYFLLTGSIAGFLLFLAFGLGMLRGRTHVKVFRESLEIRNLPPAFSGMKIVQLSDIHLAGFYHDREHIKRVVSRVNGLEPDLILFTGDMVHNFADEMDPFVKTLRELQAPL
jgi:hypothetical protein